MIIKFPGDWKNKMVIDNENDIVQTHDIFDTICDIIGHNTKQESGHSFFRSRREIATTQNFMPQQYEYFFEKCKRYNSNFNSDDFITNGMQTQHAILSDRLKLIIREKGNHELYNFKNDPSEKINLIDGDNPLYLDFVSKHLKNFKKMTDGVNEASSSKPVTTGKQPKLSEEVKRELRELGYL